ncbi:unnamed protein product [Lymnaea stagnalis]|uniref:Uncharacterized protein n=1 Tax=Lymnaea stagnalis TaxID=6523 RepID=A0AAV2H443_LYMST
MSGWSKERRDTMGLMSWMVLLTLGLLSLHLAESQLCNGANAGAYPHPSDCTKYILCVAGESFERTCATGNYFDSKRNACMFPNNDSTCANGVLPAFVASVQPNFCAQNHWVDGIHPHPQTCRMYIVCSNSMPTFISCPNGQLFDPNDKTCVSAQVARPCNDAPINENLESVCTTARADILFLLDSSSSMSYQDFALQRRFVINVTNSFPVGADNVHFSVMVFSNDAQIKIPFSAQQTNVGLASNIDSISYVGSSTFTHTALDLARTFGFSAANGARPGTKKIAIVLTDGLSNNTALTLNAAGQLRQTGVHVLAVGVGRFDRTELEGIATRIGDVFYRDSFDLLHELNGEITSNVCNEERRLGTNVIRGQTYNNGIIHSNSCRFGLFNSFILAAVIPFCHNNESYADVIIVMDSSESIGYNNWRKQLDFAASLTSNFRIGPNDMRFAAISYGTVVHKLFDLKSYSLASTIGGAIKLATYQAESTNTASALKYITDQGMFNLGAGARSGATKIVIIMTDGQSNNPADTQVEASNLIAQGVHMIAIGIGNAVDFREIIAMSSSDADRFHSPGYEVLYRLEAEVKNRTCNSKSMSPKRTLFHTISVQEKWDRSV